MKTSGSYDMCYNALKDNKDIYKELVKTYEKLIDKMPSANGVTAAEVKELIFQNKQLILLTQNNLAIVTNNVSSFYNFISRNNTNFVSCFQIFSELFCILSLTVSHQIIVEVGLKITIDFASIKIRVYPMFEMEFFYLKVCIPVSTIIVSQLFVKMKFTESNLEKSQFQALRMVSY